MSVDSKSVDSKSVDSKSVEEITDANFETKVIQSKKPVLIDFWAEWCAPCRSLSPIIEDIAAEMADKMKVYKIDVSDNQQTSMKFGVMSIPTLLLFKNGQLIANKVGASSRENLVKWIESSI